MVSISSNLLSRLKLIIGPVFSEIVGPAAKKLNLPNDTKYFARVQGSVQGWHNEPLVVTPTDNIWSLIGGFITRCLDNIL